MKYCQAKKGEFIFEQGDDASCFFLIDEGSFEVIIDGRKRRTLFKGEGFGELALMYNAPRSASLKALDDSNLWFLKR